MLIVGRCIQLMIGLALCGFAVAAMARADLGLGPWDVLHQGIAVRGGISLGTSVVLVSVGVLLLWWPLKLRPGPGTFINVFVIGVVADLCLGALPETGSLAARFGLLALGVVCTGVGASIYLGSDFGPGARDGLMMGIVRRWGHPVHVVRTAIELAALCLGWLIGGTVGIGTIAFALLVGPVIHATLPWCDHRRWSRRSAAQSDDSNGADATQGSAAVEIETAAIP